MDQLPRLRKRERANLSAVVCLQLCAKSAISYLNRDYINPTDRRPMASG